IGMYKRILIFLVLILNLILTVVVYGDKNVIINKAEVRSSHDGNGSNNTAIVKDNLNQSKNLIGEIESKQATPRTGAPDQQFQFLSFFFITSLILILRSED
ncbi:MAG: hypothetical protein ACRCXZ_08660, partial [Patescibacteria group bacterium]